jgi:tRNA(Ile)-lysidine synthase
MTDPTINGTRKIKFNQSLIMLSSLHNFIKEWGFNRTYWLAYSGGLDSHVLLDLCMQLRKTQPFNLRVVHVHHGLSPNADQWTQHCQQTCAQYSIELLCLRVDARPPEGESLEAYAREKRYQALEQVLPAHDILLTAHHQDDQAETILLQLLRGAGPKGLAAMPRIKSLGQGLQGRPLLDCSRRDLQAYADAQALSWVEDESNQDSHYPRNFIRHELLPLLKTRWPAVEANLARSAAHCAEAQNLLHDFASQDLAQLAGSRPHTLSVKRLLELSLPRQRLSLRSWFENRGVQAPNSAKLFQIQQDVLQASWDSCPCIAWGAIELRRYQDDLFLLPLLPAHDVAQVYTWDLAQPLSIAGLGQLRRVAIPGQGLCPRIQQLEVRFRQGGEVFRKANGQHHELKKFFQEQGIPPWERDRLPLLWVKDELAAIPGYFIVDAFRAPSGEVGNGLEWYGDLKAMVMVAQ